MVFFMNNNGLKGIYLHGYQGYVTEEKKDYLNQLGDIYAPTIDYDQNPQILFQLYEEFKDQSLDFVSGTSLGGILIYHIALLLEVPCLLLNPAVTVIQQIKPFIPQEAFNKKNTNKIVTLVGLKDDIVNPQQQIQFFEQQKQNGDDIDLILDPDLAHFVPYDTFKHTFDQFKLML